MDRIGQKEIAKISFRSTAGVPPSVEVLNFTDVPRRVRSRGVSPYAPMRPAFHHLIVVRSGLLRHSVDFTDHVVAPGSWLWIRSGQVHQYTEDLAAARGTIVLFPSGFLDAGTVAAARVDSPFEQPLLVPAGDEHERALRTLELLESECRTLDGLPLEPHIEVVRHLLSALVLRLAHMRRPAPDDEVGQETFRRFCAAVERDFARTRRVEDYARTLGYSVRTLTRATLAATGSSAKRYLDERVVLEAKRLLVHTDLPAAAIADQLCFPAPTVFTKFFRRHDGRTPGDFRARMRGTAASR